MEPSDNPTAERSFVELRDEYNVVSGELEALDAEIAKWEAREAAGDDENAANKVLELREEFALKVAQAEDLRERCYAKDARERARSQFERLPVEPSASIKVRESDLYQRGGRSFFADLYAAQIRGDGSARDRIEKHQRFEAEKRAVTTTTMGGIIPPAYLVELYAKASRNGRVFADQVNGSDLPEVGMSVVVPRLTAGLTVAAQTSENTALSTSDPTETDLTVNVRTIGGYSPVSKQTIERGGYSDQILFEDLIARYWANLDTQCINGSNASGQMLGLLGTSSISTSTASTATVAGVWPKIADLIQQINTACGGLGYIADKIFMHPRRWGFFEAALDSQNRPIFGVQDGFFNAMGSGEAAGYGYVGRMHGLNVYTDANIPTNLGTNTNEDRIIVIASQIVHLFERPGDPVTVAFEQQAGTSLQVQLVCYGFAAFTAGRYPAASGVVSGAGLVPPTF